MQNVKSIGIFKPRKSSKKCPIHHVNYLVYGQHFACPKCVKEAKIKQQNKMLTELKNSKRDALRTESLIDDADLWKCTFNNFKVRTTQEKIVKELARHTAGKYLKYPSQEMNSVLFGSAGSGKSHLAISMLKAINHYFKEPRKCLFINTNMLFSRLYNTYQNNNSKWNEYYVESWLAKANVIVLDDFGSESGMKRTNNEASNYVQKIFFNILNQKKRIIITTNLNQNELKEMYNEKLISRLFRGAKKSNSMIDFTGIQDKRPFI